MSFFSSLAIVSSFFAVSFNSAIAQKSETPSSQALLKAADRARLPTEVGMQWTIKLTNFNDDDESTIKYKVRAKKANSFVEVVDPPRKRGEVTLFNDRVIWFYKTGQKKPISLSARQKLSGQASVGDIVSTNYRRDYEGPVVGEEKVGDVDCYILDLKAKSENTTYDRIKYYVSKKDKLLVKSIFQTSEEDNLKIATYEYAHTISIKGKKFPFTSKMTIRNASLESQYSELEWINPKLSKIPEAIFNVNNLLR